MARGTQVGFQAGAVGRYFEFSLLGMLASGYCAVVGSGALAGSTLDMAFLALAGLALALRGLAAAGVLRLPVPAGAVTAATLIYLAAYPLDYFFVSRSFLQATVHLVFFVAIAKVLTASTPRDHFFLKIIAFLQLLAASILSSNLTFFACLMAFLLAAVATFACDEILKASGGRQVVTRGAGAFARRLSWLTATATAGILVFTFALFFVLPRTARAALDRLLPPAQRVSGFAPEITLGAIGEIRRQGAPVFHARFNRPSQGMGMKWRGMALAEFNGLKWYNSAPSPARRMRPENGLLKLMDDELLRIEAPRITYDVVLNRTGTEWLFIAGTPEYLRVQSAIVIAANSGYRVPFADSEGFRYVVHATLAENLPQPPLSTEERKFHLRLPPVDARIIALARRITETARDDAARARLIEDYLRTNYRYSLTALDHETDDPLAAFLFETRRGHCEYFASAMAVLLRAVWVPSRVVTGFQSGTYNSISGWQVVRASDAHSWVEAWVPGRGWTAYDPTPPDPSLTSSGVMSRLAQWADAASMFWQEWVLGYDLDRQLTLAFRVEQSRRAFHWMSVPAAWERLVAGWQKSSRQALPTVMAWVLALVAAIPLIYFAWPRLRAWRSLLLRRRRIRAGHLDQHDAAFLYMRMLKRMERLGRTKTAAQTPAEFAASLPPGEAAAAVGEFTAAYHEFRFGARESAAARLPLLLDRIEQLPVQSLP